MPIRSILQTLFVAGTASFPMAMDVDRMGDSSVGMGINK